MCLKIDLQKAFDTVKREFIYYIMHCMGFSYKWINWIEERLSSPSFSIMLDGSPTGYFKSTRGIRKGDPISPYIFVLVMEFWSITMDLAIGSSTTQPMKRSAKICVSHLLFAEHAGFLKGHKKSVIAIKITCLKSWNSLLVLLLTSRRIKFS